MVTTDNYATPLGRRELLVQRWGALKSERASFDGHWADIDENLLPRSARFFVQDRNRGEKRWNDIIDNSGSMALDRLVGGLVSYGTSPARPWLRYRVADPDLNKYQPVAIWLEHAARRTLEIFDKSNTYPALTQLYEQLGAYGTGCSILLSDHRDVIRNFPVPIGEFCIATDFKGDVVTLYREFSRTAGEIVREFGFEVCSPAVQAAWRRGDLDQAFTIFHAIEPRYDRDTSKQDQLNMPWASVYFEPAGNPDQLLREGGFDHFPVISPRWKLRPGDTYASDCPGMRALGDIRGLQHEQVHKAEVLNQISDPSLAVPTMLQGKQIERMPGGVNYYDQNTPHGGIRRAFEVELDHTGLLQDIQDVRARIDRAFYADLFLMLAMASDTTQRTAAEIAVRQEEKMAMLGPVSRQLNRELRAPLVNITFRHLLESGQLLPPPPELHGQELDVEYLDVFSQAQKQIGVQANDRFLGVVLNLANAKPEVLDKIDVDAAIDDYAERYAVNPGMVLSTDDPRVQRIREARAKAMAAKEQVAMAQVQAKTARDLAASSTSGGNLLSNFVGYTQ